MAISVLLVEDDSFTRATVAGALMQAGFQVGEPAAGLSDALRSFQANNQDALVSDLDLGSGPSGIELANLLRRTKPHMGIVFLTSFEDPRLHRQNEAWMPGGCIYLVKQSLINVSEISDAIAESLKLAKQNSLRSDAPFLDGFTSIQLQTMQLISRGLSNAAIAQERDVSEKAVEKTVKLIAEQLGLQMSSNTNLRVSIARAYAKLTGGKF